MTRNARTLHKLAVGIGEADADWPPVSGEGADTIISSSDVFFFPQAFCALTCLALLFYD